MRQRVWSDLDKQWDGFRLTRYSLDPNKVAALSITERRQADRRIGEIDALTLHNGGQGVP